MSRYYTTFASVSLCCNGNGNDVFVCTGLVTDYFYFDYCQTSDLFCNRNLVVPTESQQLPSNCKSIRHRFSDPRIAMSANSVDIYAREVGV